MGDSSLGSEVPTGKLIMLVWGTLDRINVPLVPKTPPNQDKRSPCSEDPPQSIYPVMLLVSGSFDRKLYPVIKFTLLS